MAVKMIEAIPRVRERKRGNREVTDASVEARFGSIIASELWGIIPMALFRYQKDLNLSTTETWFLCVLFLHKWTEEDPFPSLSAMSRRSGRRRQTLQRVVRGLCRRGLLVSEARFLENGARASNTYEIQPLIDKLEELVRKDPRSNFNRGGHEGEGFACLPSGAGIEVSSGHRCIEVGAGAGY